MNASISIIDDLFEQLIHFFQTYGWYFVFSFLAFVWYAKPLLTELFRKISLAQANNPKRRSVLDEERRRVRVHQQLDVYKAHREQVGSGHYA